MLKDMPGLSQSSKWQHWKEQTCIKNGDKYWIKNDTMRCELPVKIIWKR